MLTSLSKGKIEKKIWRLRELIKRSNGVQHVIKLEDELKSKSKHLAEMRVENYKMSKRIKDERRKIRRLGKRSKS